MMEAQELADSAVELPHGVVFAARVGSVKTPEEDTVYILTLLFQVDKDSNALKQTFALDEELAHMMGLIIQPNEETQQ